MGYPMSYRRVINRNGLAEGGYDDKTSPPVSPSAFPGPDKFLPDVDYVALLRKELEHRRATIEDMWNKRRMLLGDLRRLELDSVDEHATCQSIALKTGIDAETVAVVLKEFIAW